MEIKVFGSGCKKCSSLYERIEKVLETNSIEADLSKVENLKEIVQNGIMKTPALMIDGKVVAKGRVPSEKELTKLIK